MKIGFIGLGIMGSRMAANLQKKGYALVVYNRTREKANALLQNGAVWAESPAEVGRQVDVLFTMLATPEAVEETALGSDGFLPAMRPGAIWIDATTVNPSFSRKMAAQAHERQVRFIDAPVGGSKDPAEKAQLWIMAGGTQADVEECRPLFEAIGRQLTYMGETGMGAAMKMVNNLLLGQSMLAFAEALVLGQAMGIERDRLFDTLNGAIVTAPMTALKRGKIESGQYDADFPLRWLQKDLQLAAQSAYEEGVALPATNVAKEIYQLANRAGLGEKDIAAIYQFLNETKRM